MTAMTPDDLLALLDRNDSAFALEEVSRQDDPLGAVQLCHETLRALYWQRRDIPAVILVARMGIQHGLATAVAETDPVRSAALRSAAKALAYDLASFTWPGWDEPGIALGPSDLRIGLDAARTNLRLAIELEKGLLPLARAHWLLGAHLLSALDTASSIPHFEEAANAADAAGSPAEALLARGFAALAAGQHKGLQDVLTELRALPDGDGFAAQIETARRALRLQPLPRP